jgi:Toprim domain
MPCILGRFTDVLTNASRGLHRRVITPDVVPKTMALGPIGGAVVRLWPDEDVTHGLVIGEGVETVLAAATGIEHRGTLLQPAWACTVAGNVESFPVLAGVEALTILADADANGRGQRAVRRCAERWAANGCEVTILTPRELGDFNDIVRSL